MPRQRDNAPGPTTEYEVPMQDELYDTPPIEIRTGRASVGLLKHSAKSPGGFTYVIVSSREPEGAVKIGWAKDDPHARLERLQTANAYRLKLVDVVPGSQRVERTIHAQLRGEGTGGGQEWFFGERTREMVLTIHAAAVECLRYADEFGEMPEDDDVLDCMGITPPPIVQPVEKEPGVRFVPADEFDRGKDPDYLAQLHNMERFQNPRSRSPQLYRGNPLNSPGKGRTTSGVRELDELRIDGKLPLYIRRKAA